MYNAASGILADLLGDDRHGNVIKTQDVKQPRMTAASILRPVTLVGIDLNATGHSDAWNG